MLIMIMMIMMVGLHDDDDHDVALGNNWVTIELVLGEISWICPTIYPDIKTSTIYSDILCTSM